MRTYPCGCRDVCRDDGLQAMVETCPECASQTVKRFLDTFGAQLALDADELSPPRPLDVVRVPGHGCEADLFCQGHDLGYGGPPDVDG